MASTDQRTGFRFGWGSSKGDGDKSADQPRQAEEPQGAPDPSPSDPRTPGAPGADAGHAWPTSDVRGGAPADLAPGASGFLSELMRAMQAAADQTRKQIMDRFGDEARAHVDSIRSRSGEDLNELRRVADADVAGIREWSKAEIARIKSETDERIAARRTELERQVEGHGALVDREVDKFQVQVSAFEQQMDGFFSRLQQVADPSTFAAVAQGMPEPPQIELLGQNARAEALAEAPLSAPATSTVSSWDQPRPAEAQMFSATSTESSPSGPVGGDTGSSSGPVGAGVAGSSSAHPDSVWSGGPTPATISDWSGGATSPIPASPEGWSDDQATASPSAGGWTSASTPATGSEWVRPTSPATGREWEGAPAPATGSEWEGATPARTEWGSSPSGASDGGWSGSSAPGGMDAWGAQTPNETTTPAEQSPPAATSTFQGPEHSRDGDPIVYGAPAPLVAEALTGSTPPSGDGAQASPARPDAQPNLEDGNTWSADARLAALGIVRRDAAPSSPAQAPAPSMFSVTPAEVPAPAPEPSTAAGAGAQASESAFASMPGQDFNTNQSSSSESSAARLAGLVPSSELPANGRTAGAPAPTHVIVTGLLSVASIASFKRHLSRIPGVQGVGVSSGPDGEFIFKTTHDPGVALAAVIPTLPGFGAEVVKSGEGTIQVAAHDPEADA